MLIIRSSISQITGTSTSFRSINNLVIHCPLRPVPITPICNFLEDPKTVVGIMAVATPAAIAVLTNSRRFIFFIRIPIELNDSIKNYFKINPSFNGSSGLIQNVLCPVINAFPLTSGITAL